MSTDISIHHVTSIKAESGHGDHANWVDICITGKTGLEQEITLFTETGLLAGLIAKKLNEAQIDHDRIKGERDRIAAEFGTSKPVL